jgi:hypothetical protein
LGEFVGVSEWRGFREGIFWISNKKRKNRRIVGEKLERVEMELRK